MIETRMTILRAVPGHGASSTADLEERLTSFAESPLDAVDFLETYWSELVAEHPLVLRSHIMSLPEQYWGKNPSLLIALASTNRFCHPANPFAAITYIDAADRAMSKSGTVSPDLMIVSLIERATAYRAIGRLDDSLELATRVISELNAATMPVTRRMALEALALAQRGICLMFRGELEAARRDLSHALRLGEGSGSRALDVEVLGCLALLTYFSGAPAVPGDYVALARAASDGTSIMRTVSGAPALVTSFLLALDEGRVDEAEAAVDELRRVSPGSEYDPLTSLAIGLLYGGLNVHLDELDELEHMQIALREWQSAPLLQQLHDAHRSNALISIGEFSVARETIGRLTADAHHAMCPGRYEARLAFAVGDYDAVLRIAAACHALGDGHSPRSLVFVDILAAAAHHCLGDLTTARAGFDRALMRAARTGWRRHFIEIPHDRLRRMLDETRSRHLSEDARQVVEELSETLRPDNSVESLPPLSPRERLVLQQIIAGQTRQQISSRLMVSPNTVKAQVRSIYRKLGVVTRHEAVHRARKFGLTA